MFYTITNNTTSRVGIGNDIIVDDKPVFVPYRDLTQQALSLYQGHVITISPDPFSLNVASGTTSPPPPSQPPTQPAPPAGGVRMATGCGCPPVPGIYPNSRPPIIRS